MFYRHFSTLMVLMVVFCGVNLSTTDVYATDSQNMIGRQSQNEGLNVLPAKVPLKIDGDLADWDLSGRIWIFADMNLRDRYSVQAAAMWDQDYLYLSAQWRDPTPMFSAVDPNFNPGDGWRSDAMQLRIKTADEISWLTTWYFTARNQAVLDVVHWDNMSNPKQGTSKQLLIGKPGDANLGSGAMLVYHEAPDGQGFVQEMRIPWSMIHRSTPSINPQLPLQIGMEFIWGDPTGKEWPVHRYADNMQPGKTSREFFWTATSNWGQATLLDHGNIALREYVPDVEKIAGTIPVRATIPVDAQRFTLVMEDRLGNRVRTLAADVDASVYNVNVAGDKRTVEVLWDGLNDSGEPVAPGSYQLRGLSRGTFDAQYDMCYYNPGTPTWKTRDGKGAWGADHYPPKWVARAGDIMVLAWKFAEGGSGIIGIGPDGTKAWSQYRGADCMTADKDYVYAYQGMSWHSAGMNAQYFCRYSAKDGSEQPYILDGKPRPFDLQLGDLLGDMAKEPSRKAVGATTGHDQPPSMVSGMTVHGDVLVLTLRTNKIALLDRNTAKLIRSFDADQPSAPAFAPNGKLYAMLGQRVCEISLKEGVTHNTWPTPDAMQITSINFDAKGNLLVADMGSDQQIKAYSPDGKLQYTCAVKGGRPDRGLFNKQSVSHVSSIATDAQNQVWAVENWDFPRRVSVWNQAGKLVRDYVGNTGYSGSGSYLHNQDPTLAYVGPVEMKLNHDKRTFEVTRILWVPDESKGECFPITLGSNARPQRFRSMINGQMRELLYLKDEKGPHTLFAEFPDGWRPFASVGLIGLMEGSMNRYYKPQAMPSGQWEGLDPADGYFWNDANEDGIPQRDECVIVPTTRKSQIGKPITPALALLNGWGGNVAPDLSFFCFEKQGQPITHYMPIGHRSDGLPIFGPQGMKVIDLPGCGDLFVVDEGKTLVSMGANHGGTASQCIGIDLATSTIKWSYPNRYPGVHGSHNATMPEPGLLIGPLKICGTANLGSDIGNIIHIRGNLGQDFIFTTDGIYVASIFQDTRLPAQSLPVSEKQLIGQSMAGYSQGGEPFNGWFGKQDDGIIRQSCGMPGQAAMILQMEGLHSIKRFSPTSFNVTQDSLAKALGDNALRQHAAQQHKDMMLSRVSKALTIDGKLDDWKTLPSTVIARKGQPEHAESWLAYDRSNLYVAFDVIDGSPWKNSGSDITRLFKTGDAVDVQLSVDPNAKQGKEPGADTRRLLIAQHEGKPVVVLMQPIDASASSDLKKIYTSPVMTKVFERVQVLENAQVKVTTRKEGYTVEASIPLATLGLALKRDMILHGDLGFITSDEQGLINTARVYWSNPKTNLVNDLPSEAWLYPQQWGQIKVQ
jgi:hypothetical protein